MSEKTDIKSMDLEELKTFFSDMGEKAFRAKQVYEWLHVRQVESFEEMTNLSKTLRCYPHFLTGGSYRYCTQVSRPV